MSQELRRILDDIRRVAMSLINLLDEALGYERTIPTKEDRQLLKQIKNK
jgi:hypothetical protein